MLLNKNKICKNIINPREIEKICTVPSIPKDFVTGVTKMLKIITPVSILIKE